MGPTSSESGTGQPLRGTQVLVTRSPERSTGLVAALEAAGATALVLPLIDFERAADQHALEVACDGLGAGAFEWLVVSSATTVHVLVAQAVDRGRSLGAWLPAATRVAAIGPATRRLLEANGVTVTLVPAREQSAAGLLEVWPGGTGPVLLPQADIAASRLADGLAASGSNVTAVTAYRTVDFPAAPERRLAIAAEPGTPQPRLVSAATAAAGMSAGTIHAVVAASPSAVRRLAVLFPLQACRLIAIGTSTADQAAELGWPAAAVATDPTSAGLVEALTGSIGPGHEPGLAAAPP
ncbi:uroporphyrinogen-III synthase [Arthrobacter sp. G.S.26]|uniref:uroporphyrinogen-III synthase n=1 Tax=Micrococcaceae TaxID=1268 RepID=UPI002555D8A1|nr:uroporphyrinogen-III synthase [Pseudarthrobacter sp. MEB009]